MEFKDLKYLLAFLIPFVCFLGIQQLGEMSWATVILVFVLIPIIESAVGSNTRNLSASSKSRKSNLRFFDWLLYLNLPVVYGTLFFFIKKLDQNNLNNLEYTGLILSVGIVLGACGINVAHELGHRKNATERFLAKMLLLPSWYMHFIIEHNQGHHKNIATDLDPASARKGEPLYAFWLRSVAGSYLHAWKLEKNRLAKANLPFWNIKNEMLVFSIAQISFLLLVFLLCQHWYTFQGVVLAGIVSFLLLETINYIEHYGLRRKKLPSGLYERVQPQHSWNADFEIGRILLYELTRHSDHHFIATKKYQTLDHHDQAPELPFGYPTAMLTALVPPLWFYIMDKRIPDNALIM